MERQEFIDRCNDIFKNWIQFDTRLNKLLDIGAIDLNNVEPNYYDCYPVVAAILERCARECINGSVYEDRRRRQKRQMNNYLNLI